VEGRRSEGIGAHRALTCKGVVRRTKFENRTARRCGYVLNGAAPVDNTPSAHPFPMRLLLELVVAGLIIVLAWEKSFKERVADIPVVGEKLVSTKDHPRSSVRNPRPGPSVSGAWMWDPNRKTALDRPSPTPRAKEDH
jgi:hypothetical protein